MSRNVFERGPVLSREDLEVVKDGPYIILPPLAEGYRYEIVTLPSGGQAVVTVGP